MAKKRYYNKMDRGGSMMIKEDRNATANLPQKEIMKEYPKVYYRPEDNLNDDIRGIDAQISEDARGRKKRRKKYPEKY